MLFAAWFRCGQYQLESAVMVDFFSALLSDEAQTHALAQQIAAGAKAGDIYALEGDLGAGKSTFARAFIRARMLDEKLDVPSPTFTLVQVYEPTDGPSLFHADLYRLSSPDDVEDLGLYDEVDQSVMLIEWPDRMPEDWWQSALSIELTIPTGTAEGMRNVRFSARDKSWQTRLDASLKAIF